MSHQVLARIQQLLPEIEARAQEVEDNRRIPPDLIGKLKEAGVFRAMTPKSFNGEEIDYPASVDMLTDLARADGSVGWSLMIGCETPQLLALLPESTFRTLYEASPDVVVGGAFAPKGSARSVDGGFEVSGRWGFASGCEHADWLFGNCLVDEGKAGLRCMMLPASDWQIHDTWHTAGLKGTGSHDIELRDTFVPEAYTFDLFGGTPCMTGPLFAAPLVQFALHIGAVALGIAEGAVQELTDFAMSGKTRLYGRGPMLESELFQTHLGRAQADAQAARAMLHWRVSEYWALAAAGDIPVDYQTQVLQTEAWVVAMCANVVDRCYTAGGGSALYHDSPLQRRLRDIHTLTQHASAQEGAFANAGAAMLGKDQGFGL